jgi:hypothetical protein
VDHSPTQEPHRYVGRTADEPFLRPCCLCNRLTADDIYIRGPASDYHCGGNHVVNATTWLLTHRMVGTWIERYFVDIDPKDGIDE